MAEPKEPTMAELAEMSQKAMAVAEEAKTAAEARADVQQAVETEAEDKGYEISEEQAKMIAGVMIAEMEARGAFEPQAGSAPAAVDEGATGPEPGAEPVGEPAGEGVEAPAPPPAEGSEQAPRRKSLAERFQGR